MDASNAAQMHRIPWWCVACERQEETTIHARPSERQEETTIHARPSELAERVKPPKGWIRGRLDGTPVTLCLACASDACVAFGDDPSPRIKRLVEKKRGARA
jgi:hypothetical protein